MPRQHFNARRSKTAKICVHIGAINPLPFRLSLREPVEFNFVPSPFAPAQHQPPMYMHRAGRVSLHVCSCGYAYATTTTTHLAIIFVDLFGFGIGSIVICYSSLLCCGIQ
jgi:hypothetical protein